MIIKIEHFYFTLEIMLADPLKEAFNSFFEFSDLTLKHKHTFFFYNKKLGKYFFKKLIKHFIVSLIEKILKFLYLKKKHYIIYN